MSEWGGRKVSMGHWHELGTAYEDARMRIDAIDHWQVRMYARAQLMGPRPPELMTVVCDLCGYESRQLPGPKPDVWFCAECHPSYEVITSHREPWWLRALRWLAKL